MDSKTNNGQTRKPINGMKIDSYTVTAKERQEACNAVIDALSKYHPAVKLAALHTCIETFPKEWMLMEVEKNDN